MHAAILRGNMGYDKAVYIVLLTVAVESSFVAFLKQLQTYCKMFENKPRAHIFQGLIFGEAYKRREIFSWKSAIRLILGVKIIYVSKLIGL